jgi:hypothetical protein
LLEHWFLSADAIGVATNRAAASAVSATIALSKDFRVTGAKYMWIVGS